MTVILLFVAVTAAWIVALNVSEGRRRARMTPEARAAEDEETAAEMQIW
jgi:hypothetical protein